MAQPKRLRLWLLRLPANPGHPWAQELPAVASRRTPPRPPPRSAPGRVAGPLHGPATRKEHAPHARRSSTLQPQRSASCSVPSSSFAASRARRRLTAKPATPPQRTGAGPYARHRRARGAVTVLQPVIACESARNAPSSPAPKSRTSARLDRSNASSSAGVRWPRRIQTTFGGGPGRKLTWWKSESFKTNGETVVLGMIPDRGVGRSGQSDVSNVDGPRKDLREASDETRGHIVVEEELHPGGLETSRRSRSAANASAARMSSGSRSGKSARISDSVIPEATCSRTSYTVILSPRMHGFPPLFSGSRVMQSNGFISSRASASLVGGQRESCNTGVGSHFLTPYIGGGYTNIFLETEGTRTVRHHHTGSRPHERMGSPKQLLPYRGRPILQHVVDLAAGAAPGELPGRSRPRGPADRVGHRRPGPREDRREPGLRDRPGLIARGRACRLRPFRQGRAHPHRRSTRAARRGDHASSRRLPQDRRTRRSRHLPGHVRPPRTPRPVPLALGRGRRPGRGAGARPALSTARRRPPEARRVRSRIPIFAPRGSTRPGGTPTLLWKCGRRAPCTCTGAQAPGP